MDLSSSLPSFLVAVLLISASPGPAMALILRRAALHGFRAAVPTVAGLEAGLFIWAMLAAAGFAALVAASETAFVVLRAVGAAVLVVLGVKAWLGMWRSLPATAVRESAPPPRTGWRSVAEAVAVSLANPKAAVFMVAFYPQFVPADRPLFATTALFAAAQVALETALYLALAAGVARAGGWFRRSTIRRRLDAVSGAVLVGLGVRMAASGQ